MSEEKDFLDDFVDTETAAEPVEQAEPAPEPEPERASGPARGPDGKFIKAEAEAKAGEVEKGAKEAVEVDTHEPPSEGDEKTVPISVVQALRREIQELKRSKGDQKQTQPQPSVPQFAGPSVDFDEDPRSYLEGALHNQKMQMSSFMAGQEFGQDTVNAAWVAFDEACRHDPQASAMSYALLNHPHPIREVVNWYRSQQELAAIREAGGLEALKEKWLAEAAQQRQPAVQSKPNVPPSLAGTGKARPSEATGEDTDGFEALFN